MSPRLAPIPVVALLVAHAALAIEAHAQLAVRGSQAPPADAISSLDERGVYTVDSAGTLHLIPWDRVLRIEGPRAADAAPYMPLAEAAWRARARLQRGDAVSAEPLFEDLFHDTRDWRGPTRAVIAEGLMRCRLRRAAQIGAIEPWLALLDARASAAPGIQPWATAWARDAGLGEVLDAATGLAPALPPMWLDWPAVRQFAAAGQAPIEGDPASAPAPAGEQPAALRDLYLAAARFEAGLDTQIPAATTSDPGVRLVRDVVAARIGSPQDRASARERLRERLAASGSSAPPPWLNAWLRVAIGRSLLREPDEDARQLGIAELLAAPALHAADHPYLAGLALAEAARALSALGRHEQSALLRQELADRFPAHPALTIVGPGTSPRSAGDLPDEPHEPHEPAPR